MRNILFISMFAMVFSVLSIHAGDVRAEESVQELAVDGWETREISFNYYNRNAFYACSYAEARAEEYLANLGAQNIQVRCRGGLPHQDFVNIDASFDVAVGEGTWTSVSLSGREACDFNSRLLDKLIEQFTVKSYSKKASCWDAKGRWSFDLTVLQ